MQYGEGDSDALQKSLEEKEDEFCEKNGKQCGNGNWTSMFPTGKTFGETFERHCGFKIHDLTSFERFVKLLYRPTDPASLGVVRALFGLCMVLDIVEERGLADIDLKWGDPNGCHFPLIHGMKTPPLPWTIVLYAIMWMGAGGIMLGVCFKTACACFIFPYWYFFILDKTFWNNHSYLYGVVAILFWGTDANKYFALGAKMAKHKESSVPLWNYFILKFQFFALYFLAGLKKSGKEWLDGYAMTNLSRHWVFDPFKLVLTTEHIDFFIVHWFGFVFDLTVGFWMLFDKTRIPAMIFCTSFHLMNSRLFSIGMFPWVCLATMPLFCHVDWPRKIQAWIKGHSNCERECEKTPEECPKIPHAKLEKNVRFDFPPSEECETDSLKDDDDNNEDNVNVIYNEKSNVHSSGPVDQNGRTDQCSSSNRSKEELSEEKLSCSGDNVEWQKSGIDETPVNAWRHKDDEENKRPKVTRKQKVVVSLLFFHIAMQLFLPYSHFVTKGYNNWVPGLYGYSWDMMVHSWDTILVVIKVHDNENNENHYMDPQAWVQGDRWSKHGDMIKQHAFCLKENLMNQKQKALASRRKPADRKQWARLSTNLSIYIDVWCSLNGRFQQRMFNPNVDILTAEWHPFKPVSYLMPLLTQFSSYRYKLDEIQRHVYTWSNYTDVLFVADFPGMHLENYITKDLSNVTLTVLEGEVVYAEEDWKEGVTLTRGGSLVVENRKFHKIQTISSYPACYMYTYTNQTKQQLESEGIIESPPKPKDAWPIIREIKYKINAWGRAFSHITNAFFYLVYDVPMLRRVRID